MPSRRWILKSLQQSLLRVWAKALSGVSFVALKKQSGCEHNLKNYFHFQFFGNPGSVAIAM